MSRRAFRLLVLLAALALVAATGSGCGSSGSGGGGLDSALKYVPKDAPVVVALDTDPDGDQWQQVEKLIGKFPGGGQAKEQFKSAFSSRSGVDWDKDVRPLLGNDLVVAYLGGSSATGGARYVLAWPVKDEDAAKRLLDKGGSTRAELRDGTLIAARTQEDLDAALKRAGGDDHMSEDDFTAALGDVNQDGLLRVAGNVQALIGTTADAAAARKVKWVSALRTFGASLSADPDGIAWQFDVKTDSGSLTAKDLPLASGSQAVPVVRRAGEIGVGVRNPAQLYIFGQAAARITDPAGYAKFLRQKAKASKELGVNIDRDVIAQLTGNTDFSVALDGKFAMRADLRDPAAMEATLKRAAPNLKKLAKRKGSAIAVPKNGKGFYTLTAKTGKKYVFGVVGKSFVVATDAARAAQFAGQSPSTVNGAKGAFVLASDARALANAAAAKRGQGVAAQLITGSLGDLIGWAESETSGLKGTIKLFIK
jgi:hypothetical protein